MSDPAFPTPKQLVALLGSVRIGRATRHLGDVHDPRWLPRERRLVAAVAEHDVEVRLLPDGQLQARCSCGGQRCVHADAAMLSWARNPTPRAAGPGRAPAAEPTPADLVPALVDAGHGHRLDQPVRTALAGLLHPGGIPMQVWGQAGLREVLQGLDPRPGVAGAVHARELVSAVRELLRQPRIASIDQALLALRPAPDAPGQPLLERWLHAYRAGRPRLGAQQVGSKLEGYTCDEAEGWIDLHVLDPASAPRLTRVRFQLQGPLAGQVRCACGAPACLASQAALAWMVQALIEPTVVPVLRSQVLELMAPPDWRRGAQAVRDALQGGPAPWPDEEGRLPGWELEGELGTLTLSSVLCRAYSRKEGLRTWASSAHLAPQHHRGLPLPADRQVAVLAWSGHLREPAALVAALQLLADHPRLVHQGRPLQVRGSRLVLRWARHEGRARLVVRLGEMILLPAHLQRLAVLAAGCAPVPVLEPDTGTVHLLDLDPRLPAALLRATRIEDWPAEGLAPLLPDLSEAMTVELDDEVPATPRAADPQAGLVLQLGPDGSVRVDLQVHPLPGRARAPGAEPRRLWSHEGDGLVFADRDLDAERAGALALARALGLAEPQRPWGWTLHDPSQILPFLERLDLLDPGVARTWLGPTARVVRANLGDLSLKVTGGGGWLDIGASVQVDGQAVHLERLREALRQGRDHVELEPGRWLRLARELASGLSALDGQGEGEGSSLRLHELAADGLLALEEGGARIVGNAGWRGLAQRIRAAGALRPEPTPGLRAELRPYQQEGLLWLRRRAAWAPGAVLADDMGLGKTVQALGLLLHRQQEGPALVVAPTSVGFNWLAEARHFAPSLQLRAYRGADRAALLQDLGPGCLVVTSWDLLARDEEALSAVAWGTVILDEAQAIKNAATRRARASRQLQAGFTLALSGTPLENHVGELWSLFRAVVPGLLGSQERFRTRFEAPIVRRDDPAARAALASLLRPFLLRRTKAEVAAELPARQEICLEVELSAEERALYEAARRDALERFATGPGDRFHVLAALTRLRQLACHGRLVLPEAPATSAKLDALLDLLEEVREGGHKALVFSQFTRHLDLVAAALGPQGYRLRRIDGGTPAEQRQREVEAFQRGEGDVFLISLKAGGTGLNLTAATYVVHMDPWWNPAVEDQATDRAHRIGQRQPVTVYRLVARDTVEQAIVALHERKRALADALIAGADGGAALSVDELVGLIRGDEPASGVEPLPSPPASPAPAPQPLAEPQGIDIGAWLARFQLSLESDHAAGRLSTHTRRNYAMAATHLAAWLDLRGRAIHDPGELEPLFSAYCEELAAGSSPVGRKTDLTLGRPAIRRWAALPPPPR
ncbi:DEAD/DEAH box helicase [Myxococcota bacterium]|nr:DEAD/DEAH box helicase [Myxococcota bacterium]